MDIIANLSPPSFSVFPPLCKALPIPCSLTPIAVVSAPISAKGTPNSGSPTTVLRAQGQLLGVVPCGAPLRRHTGVRDKKNNSTSLYSIV